MLHGRKVIGIVPTAPLLMETENRYDDKYMFTDTYEVRVAEAGMVPVGVLPVEGRIRTDVLELCDAFVVQGGTHVRPYHIDVIDHAVKTGKKLLGICLGCQAIQCYFATRAEAEKRQWKGDMGSLFAILRKTENTVFLKPVEGHRLSEIVPREDTSALKHRVLLSEGSLAAKVFGLTSLMGVSLHSFCIDEPAPGLAVSGRAEDGTVEAVEHGDRILGTQFHPDADGELPMVFAWLAK